MAYEQLAIARQLKDLTGQWHEAFMSMKERKKDFTIDKYRFIYTDAIFDVMIKEFMDDRYLIGCFSARLLASLLGCEAPEIREIQDADLHSALGSMIINSGLIGEFVEESISEEGYGSHFASDGRERMINDYYIFRIK